ncbi:PadR family transcriptional regulator [Paenibacillus macquariensis]|uniref:Transcriptional regulator PadR-like family protein n=1 Tax=Paenibacillus macquariensis TaxID=948756 RepID=A0ABY1K1W4_9BACL|nr:PadR family transcriptional regulator [Paenibacillus macquariensis]MEC0091712.1 PadR family transcriptional regulator [Paenibacillus macquariensis]OAB32362.1 PadR family transcriptional regulator [Paenibacillus macquariensis subsp. macquariensis]SIR13493.1 Transcriptional regulator PadR-like family protein [Paenibacillus macquariensis]
MIDKVLTKYIPMTETAFYILLSLTEPRHGYGIVKHVEEITLSRIRLGSGTVYGTLTKMQKDGIITVFADEERRTVYEITELGKRLITVEINRLKELHQNALKYEGDFDDYESI